MFSSSDLLDLKSKSIDYYVKDQLNEFAIEAAKAFQLVNELKKQEKTLERKKLETDSLQTSIEQLTDECNSNQETMKQLNGELKDLTEEENNTIAFAESTKNKERLVCYWQDEIHEKRNPLLQFGAFGQSMKKFEYNDIPFDEIKYDIKNGALRDEKIDKESGTYSAIYHSQRGQDGDATVQLLVKHNQLPENKQAIKQTEDELDKIAARKESVQLDIKACAKKLTHDNYLSRCQKMIWAKWEQETNAKSSALSSQLQAAEEKIVPLKEPAELLLKFHEDFQLDEKNYLSLKRIYDNYKKSQIDAEPLTMKLRY